MIKPTVGRVVWFWPYETQLNDPSFIYHNKSYQPCIGHVTFVHGDKMVNLDVIDHEGNHHSCTSVELVQEEDNCVRIPGTCEWMPYQKGQAAKTEKLLDTTSLDEGNPS